MDWILSPEAWFGFLTLTALEIVLGIDNIVFISILAGRLPAHRRRGARQSGLLLAMGTRILLLLSLSWVIGLTAPLFEALGRPISGRDLVLLLGGLFLVAKSTHEIHHKLEGKSGRRSAAVAPSYASVLVQIMLLDVVFSLDSVITAVGMVQQIWIMVAAVMAAVGFMMVFSHAISGFVERHPTVKMLALSFLLMIGVMLIADGQGPSHPEGLRLLRHGVLGVRRDDEPQGGPHRRTAGEAARTLRGVGRAGAGAPDAAATLLLAQRSSARSERSTSASGRRCSSARTWDSGSIIEGSPSRPTRTIPPSRSPAFRSAPSRTSVASWWVWRSAGERSH
jgi:predicted tellurium resistance membrane protein TerC